MAAAAAGGVTFDVPTAAIVTGVGAGAATFGWFLVRLTIFDAIKELRDSAIRQGKRFGDEIVEIKKWQTAHDAVEDYKQGRRLTAAGGVPQNDDTPTDR